MARRANTENLYRRGSTWWARITIGGVEHRGSLRTADLKQAQTNLGAWRAKLEAVASGSSSTRTFKAAVVKWAAEVLPKNCKPSTARRYLISVRSLDVVFGDLAMVDIDKVAISRYVSARTKSVTNATLRRDITALSSILESCQDWEWRSDNPAHDYNRKSIRERREPIEPPTPEEVATLISYAPPGMAAIIRVLDQSGMREAEAVSLERFQVNDLRKQLTLTKTKTNRPRVLSWKTPAGDLSEALALGEPQGFLFLNRDGATYARFANNFIQLANRVVLAEAASGRTFRRFRAHDLRHAFAVRWLRNGGSIYRLSRHLGHSNLKTTEGYLRWLSVEEEEAVRAAA
ncbi:MAG: tyrosine-type recombinase/integrase [Janthinobacterium lividum]